MDANRLHFLDPDTGLAIGWPGDRTPDQAAARARARARARNIPGALGFLLLSEGRRHQVSVASLLPLTSIVSAESLTACDRPNFQR